MEEFNFDNSHSKGLFPDPSDTDEEGMLALGGNLSIQTLLAAYSRGIFPWFTDDSPVMWWCPDPRMVLFPEKHKISKSLRQKINRHVFEIKIDTNFREVIGNCADIPRKHESGTWITGDMQQAYTDLHEEGFAHSFEIYKNDILAGGLYGVSLGRAFFGESMFHIETDASKVAFYYLVQWIKRHNFHFIDAQLHTKHLESLGANTVTRGYYLELLDEALKYPTLKGKWDCSCFTG